MQISKKRDFLIIILQKNFRPQPVIYNLFNILSPKIKWNDFLLRKEVGGTISSRSTILEFCCHGADFAGFWISIIEKRRVQPKNFMELP